VPDGYSGSTVTTGSAPRSAEFFSGESADSSLECDSYSCLDYLAVVARGKEGPGADRDKGFVEERSLAAHDLDVGKPATAIDERIEHDFSAEERLRGVSGGNQRKRSRRRKSLGLFSAVFRMLRVSGGFVPGDVLLLQQCDCVMDGEDRAQGVLLRGCDGKCVVAKPLAFDETDYFVRAGGGYRGTALAQDNVVIEKE
jgi:hypothetical protein